MSSAGEIAGGLIGGAIGTAFGGNTMLGAQIGMMIGGMIDPPKGPTQYGPRLSDLTIQTSTYGAFIARDYGRVAHSGNVFWLEGNKIKETAVKKKSGGKGGKKTVSVTYVNTATFAVGLSKGPVDGVRRIWVKGELFYDAGSTDRNTIIASNAAANGFRFYPGTDTQMPDPRIQADLGVANTPAWRGRAYIVFYDLDLAKYGEALAGAQVKVELFKEGSYGDVLTSNPAPNNRWISCKWDGNRWFGIAQEGLYAGSYSGDVFYTADGLNFTTVTALDAAPGAGHWIDLVYNGSVYMAVAGWGVGYGNGTVAISYDLDNWTTGSMPGGTNQGWEQLIVNGQSILALSSSGFTAITSDGIGFVTGTGPTDIRKEGRGCWNGTVYCVAQQSGSAPRALYTSVTGLSGWTTAYPSEAFSNMYGCCAGPGGRLVAVGTRASDGAFCVTYSDDDGATWSAANYIATNTIHNIAWTADVQLYVAATFNSSTGVGVPGPWFTSPDLVTWTQHVLPGGSLLYDRPAWDGVQWALIRNCQNENSDIQLFRPNALLSTNGTTLGAIVSAECLGSGLLSPTDIDVTSLTPAVRGYSVSTLGTIRSALEPLQVAWPFDVIQSGYKIRFKLRGSASAGVIRADDLDARDSGSAPGVQITTNREMDTQLPARVTIKYLDYDREYEIGEQYDERLNTDAVSRTVHDLAIVMVATEGAGKAQTTLYQAWLDRYDVAFSLPATYNHVEPGDVLTLESPEGDIDVRLISVNYTSDGRVECLAKMSRAAIYTPTIVGATSLVSGVSTIPGSGASDFVMLDVPMLHPVQADSTALVSMYGATGGWPGGLLVRTDDGGTTWVDVQGFSSPGGAVGRATSVLGVVDSRVWDKGSVLTLTMQNGDLYSATELAVLNGANYFAYGAHGRWEIIGVQNCTLTGTTSYALTDMLRGRFGTEWAMGTHLAGDRVVALSSTDVTAIGLSTSSIGLSRNYRGITLGQTIDTGTDTPFTYTGVNLECLSPVYFTASPIGGTSDWGFSWIRRSRTDGEWRDLVDAGLGETAESYELDIFTDNSFSTVTRTLTSSTPSVVYSSVQQTADFGTAQVYIYARLYQMSAVVGRGYPAEAQFAAPGNDYYWSNTVLSMPMDVAGLVDLKGNTPTLSGGIGVSATQSLTAGYSAYFDGVDDRVAFPASADWDMSGGTFTIEWAMYPTTMPTPGTQCRIFLIGVNGSTTSLYIGFDDTGAIQVYVPYGAPTGLSASAGSVVLNAMNIFELSVSAGQARLFKSGALIAGPISITLPTSSSSNQLFIGWDTVATVNFKYAGYLDRVRLAKGVARHTLPFVESGAAFPTY